VRVILSVDSDAVVLMHVPGTDAQGRGLLYRGVVDCFVKMWKTEGIHGFFKGFMPNYIRLGPHTVLCFVFWDALREFRSKFMSRQHVEDRNVKTIQT
jgi:solute carrier family 25 protein 34/35